jgi:uncharacterized membrane protein
MQVQPLMMWHAGDGWGWCGVNVITTVAFWGVVVIVTAVVLATRFRGMERSGPSAQGGPGFTRTEYLMAEGFTRSEMDSGEFYRRLM